MPVQIATRCERVEQVAIVDKLLRYPRGATLREMANAIDASEKTVRRIVSFLEQRFGVQVNRYRGPDAVWRYVDQSQRVFTDNATRRIG
jgi:predicted ArsR family transcriptional regulator